MRRSLLAVLGTLLWVIPVAAVPVSASLKTLDGILGAVEVPAVEGGSGVQPLAAAVAAADAFLQSLDPFGLSGARMEKPVTGKAAGTGILVGRVRGYPAVLGVVPGSPAWTAPIGEGDRILAINGEAIPADLPIADLQARLSGDPGGDLELKLLFRHEQSTGTVSLKLAPVGSGSHVRMLPGKIGFATLYGDVAPSLAGLQTELAKLPAKELVGFVLDLRAAFGGTPEDAAALASPFLADKAVVTVVEAGKPDRTLRTAAASALRVPLVVLVGHGTGGAAEAAAASLQASKRALVLGGATQGWALAYASFEKGGAFLSVPRVLLRAGDGSLITGRGVKPDIVLAPGSTPKGAAQTAGEQYLAFAKGVKWEPPKAESDTEKQLKSALAEEGGDDEAPPVPPPANPKKPDGDEGGEGKPADDDDDTGGAGALDPFREYPFLKRHDPRLVRAVHLLQAANIFFQQQSVH